jgi:phosphoglycolate phosphatase-like HAD superfamily hydrolase
MIDVIRAARPVRPKAVLFDFDGTLSTLRDGWNDLMSSMMVEICPELPRAVAEGIIWRLTGHDTIYQMEAFGHEMRRLGGTPEPAAVYKQQFIDRLAAVMNPRIEDLRNGAPPDRYLVPGARHILEALRSRGLKLYLASGTDEARIKEEAGLLDITRYFDGGVFGAREDRSFTKHGLIQQIAAGPGLLGFGDGPIELQEVRRAGGVAVGIGVAPRARLVEAGADYIIRDYTSADELLARLFPPYEAFDRSRLVVRPLAERQHDLHLDHWLDLDSATPEFSHPDLPEIAARLTAARRGDRARILMMGGHVLRAGVNRHIIDLLENGFVDHIATNGAGAIHDYELARIGATTESVDRYIRTGEFGLWRETGELNDWIREAADLSIGLGENIGRRITQSDFSHRDLSVFAAAWRLGVPITVHPGVGYDIIHEHPNCDGAALGKAAYRDFLIFVNSVDRLQGGVLLNFGSSVMGPEVYLKALAMTRNAAHQVGREIRRFTTAVFDLAPIDGDYRRELPKTEAGYYFRPHKTILVRTVADGGESFYIRGDHRATLPALWRLLKQA